MMVSTKSMRVMTATTFLVATLTTPAVGFQATNRNMLSSFPSSPSVVRSGVGSGFGFGSRSPATSNLFAQPTIATNDEVKDPSTLVSAQDDSTQQASFVAIFGGVFAGSIAFIELYNLLEGILPSSIFDPFYTILPCVLSGAFIAAGIAHFALEDTFTAFVPPKGSWGGLWQVPAPGSEALGLTYEQYHSFWSGIAEVLVGSWLLVSTLQPDLLPFVYGADAGWSASTVPAALMFGLTAAVTPANIYMYTHNPVVPRIPALPYPWGHAGRGLLQCALLAVFYKLTVHSIIA